MLLGTLTYFNIKCLNSSKNNNKNNEVIFISINSRFLKQHHFFLNILQLPISAMFFVALNMKSTNEYEWNDTDGVKLK
jgi:hypothetical protein